MDATKGVSAGVLTGNVGGTDLPGLRSGIFKETSKCAVQYEEEKGPQKLKDAINGIEETNTCKEDSWQHSQKSFAKECACTRLPPAPHTLIGTPHN